MKLNMGMTSQLLASYTGQQFIKDLSWLVVILVSIAGALCTLYAVYIAYLFFTASDPTKRKAAKDRLIKVASSAIIIVALAGILRVLDVKFVTQTGDYTGASGGSGGNIVASEYTYGVRPEMKLDGKRSLESQRPVFSVAGKFELDGAEIMGDGQVLDSTGANIKFKSCSVASPANWMSDKYFLRNVLFTISEKNNNGKTEVALSFAVLTNDTQMSIPVDSTNPNIIKLVVEFSYKNDLAHTYSTTVDVILTSSNNISFY